MRRREALISLVFIRVHSWLRSFFSVSLIGGCPESVGKSPLAAMFGHQNALKSNDAVICSPVSAPGTGALRFGPQALKMRPSPLKRALRRERPAAATVMASLREGSCFQPLQETERRPGGKFP